MKKFDKFNSVYNEFVLKNLKPLPEEPHYIDAGSMLHSTEKEVIKKWSEQDPETREKWKPVVWSGKKIPFSTGQKEPAGQQEFELELEAQPLLPGINVGNTNTPAAPASQSSAAPARSNSFLGKLRNRASQLVQKPGGVLSTIAALGGQDITGTETYYVHPSVLTNTQIYMRGLPKDVKQVYHFINFNTNDTNYNNFFKALSDDDNEVAEELKDKIEDLESGVSTKPLTVYDPDPAYGKNITIRKIGTQLQAYMTVDKP